MMSSLSAPCLPRLRTSPLKQQPLLPQSKEEVPYNKRKSVPALQFTLAQTLVLVVLGSSVASVMTALFSVHRLTTPWECGGSDVVLPMRRHAPSMPPTTVVSPTISSKDHPHPKIVWLMSFPNSGTSFTIHMTREATNTTTATNYGLEGEIRDRPSVPAIQGPAGTNGPWLELVPNRTTRIAQTILTKTHCKGFCSGRKCGPDRTFHTPRSFMMGCLTGNQGVQSERGLRLTDKTYDPSLVKKAIHIFRHPLDNIVARFHLEYNEMRDAGVTSYTQAFPKNAVGFHRWCNREDENRGVIRTGQFIDRRLRTLMMRIPCFNEFYRYTQWHNLAFSTTQAMNVTTMILHYHEYSEDFPKAREKVLNFLELPRVGEGIEFHSGKIYRHYYSKQQKIAILAFLREFATADTWAQIKDYDFELDGQSSATV